MSTLARRDSAVWLKSGVAINVAPSYKVNVLPVGAQVVSVASLTINVRAGHGFAVGDKWIANTTASTFTAAKSVASVTATTVVMSAGWVDPGLVAGDVLINLGPDTSTTASVPAYDASPVKIYNDMAGAGTAVTNSEVTTASDGQYGYWSRATGAWELVRTAAGAIVDFVGGLTIGSEINPYDYGVVGDGTTDDTKRLQAAIDAVPNVPVVGGAANGGPTGTLRLQAGTYKITDTLNVLDHSYISLRGDGWNSTQIYATGSASPAIKIGGTTAGTIATGVTISDLHIYTDSDATGMDVGLSVDYAQYYQAARLRVEYFRVTGIQLKTAWEGSWDDLRIYKCGADGTATDGSLDIGGTSAVVAGQCNNTTFKKLMLSNYGQEIYMHGSTANQNIFFYGVLDEELPARTAVLPMWRFDDVSDNVHFDGFYLTGRTVASGTPHDLVSVNMTASVSRTISLNNGEMLINKVGAYTTPDTQYFISTTRPIGVNNVTFVDNNNTMTAPFFYGGPFLFNNSVVLCGAANTLDALFDTADNWYGLLGWWNVAASDPVWRNKNYSLSVGASSRTLPRFDVDVETNSAGITTLGVSNTDNGTTSGAEVVVQNGTGASKQDAMRVGVCGTGWTTAGGFIQDGGYIDADTNISGGLSLITRHASAPINFYTAGHTNLRMQLTVDGAIKVVEVGSTPAAPTAQTQAHMYMKGDKLVMDFVDGSAAHHWFYLDMTATTDQHWVYSATAP